MRVRSAWPGLTLASWMVVSHSRATTSKLPGPGWPAASSGSACCCWRAAFSAFRAWLGSAPAANPVTRAALALSALLFLRPGELRQLEWAWVDLDAAMVTIPAALMKRRLDQKVNGPPHLVPLAPQAIRQLKELRLLTGHGRYVFPSLITGERPMSDNTINLALRRMGFDRETATAHGFRAMARTMAVERLGIEPEVIEAQLAHAKSGPLGGAYDRAQYLDQRRALMRRWADYLDELSTGLVAKSPAQAGGSRRRLGWRTGPP